MKCIMKRPKRITKEFVKEFIESGHRLNFETHRPTGMVLIDCHGHWPWHNNFLLNRKRYRFDPRSMAIETMAPGLRRIKYLSRNSEEYKGVMLFILEKKLSGEL